MADYNKLLFYDIEVFAYDALVVFKDINKRVVKSFHNNFNGLSELIEDKVLVGYNNYYYDDKILTAMINGWNVHQIKQLNDKLIRNEKWNVIHPKIKSLDVFQQIDVSQPSLKKIEGNMGKRILESSVDFNIGRPLTNKEFNEVFEYCCYDVDTTIDIYKLRENSYFKSKEILLNMLGNENAVRWNTTTIAANLLLKKPLPKWSSLRVPEWMMDLVPIDVKDMWLQVNGIGDPKKKATTIDEFDNKIVFSFGGLHGAHERVKRAENVKLLDVTSMYPSIIILLEILGSATKMFAGWKDQRVAIKHTDEDFANALKLILNSASGNLENKYSILYNPKAAVTMRVYGQISLYELCKRLSTMTTILNINTDGVAFTCKDDRYKIVKEQWEKEFGLELEEKEYDLFIQKDVNNYIAVKDNEVVKVVGGDVKRYHKDNLFSNNNTRIVDIAIVENLVYGKNVLDVIYEHLDKPYLFQYILQAGPTYVGTFDNKGRQYNKINRVFAAKKGDLLLQKKRADGGLVRFADAPERMFLWNEDCSELEDFERIVDINHYYQLIRRKLEKWNEM